MIEAFRIPDGTLAMCAVNDDLWCGSRSDDSTITVINSANGEVMRQLDAPERDCRGLAYHAGNVWFLGESHLYRMNRQGAVLSVQNEPFAGMIGLTSGDNGLWTVDRTDGEPSLVLFNQQGGVLRRIAIRVSDAQDIHFNGMNFWISSPPDGRIHQLGADGAAINIFPTPANTPTGLTMIDTLLYLVDNGDDQDGDVLYRINPVIEPASRILPGALLHRFGLVNVFGSRTWDLSIYNVGGVDLRISEIVLRAGDRGFSRGQLPQQLVVAPGRFLLVRITFSPSDYGPAQDSLLIRSNDPVDSNLTVVCQGIGIFPDRTLGVAPPALDFGRVRADPERDGSRHLEMHVFNMGADPLFIQDVSNRIPDIFTIEGREYPLEVQPTDTVTFRIWFTPHSAIQYIDSVTIRSTAVVQFATEIMRGRGDATVYDAGEVLWQSGNGGLSGGGVAIGNDINSDGIRDVFSFQDDGKIECLNGFSSVEADPIWIQSFEDRNFAPENIAVGTEMFGGVNLSGRNSGDLLFASGGNGAAAYALAGEDGSFLWRWSVDEIAEDGVIDAILPGEDTDGNGMTNPALLVSNNDEASYLVRLDGETGQMEWYSAQERFSGLLQLRDLNGDGLGELLLNNPAGRITTLNGGNGRIIRSNLVTEFVDMVYAGAIGVNASDVLIFTGADSSIFAVDFVSGRTLWAVDEAIGVGNFGRLDNLAFLDDGQDVLLTCGDDRGNLIVIHDPLNGREVSSRTITNSPITALSWAPPHPEGRSNTILAGDSSGKVFMIEADHLEALWIYESERDAGAVSKVLPFDDVDLGGSGDVLALFENGDVLCISSGGDLSAYRGAGEVSPADYKITQIFPNPFNDRLMVGVQLSSPAPITITSFDSMGRQLGRRHYGILPAGQRTLEVERGQLSGVTGSIYLNVETGNNSTLLRGVHLK